MALRPYALAAAEQGKAVARGKQTSRGRREVAGEKRILSHAALCMGPTDEIVLVLFGNKATWKRLTGLQVPAKVLATTFASFVFTEFNEPRS